MGQNEPLLSPLQRRITAYAITTLAACVLAALAIAGLWLVARFMNAFSSVLWPLVIAFIASLLLQPCVRVFERRLHLGRTWAILLLFACAAVAAFAIAAWLLPVFFRQLAEFIQTMPAFASHVSEKIAVEFPDFSESLEKFAQTPWVQEALNQLPNLLKPLVNVSTLAVAKAGQTVVTIAAVCTGAALLPIYLFYFLKSNRDLVGDFGEELTFIPPHLRANTVFLIRQFQSMVLSFFRGQIIIGLIMGVLYGMGFALGGLNFGFFLGLCLGILNIVPYLGTIVGLAFILPLAYFQTGGGWIVLSIIVAVFAIVQLIEGYFLTPKIMGNQTGLHPMVIIISILFWGIALDGILGMVLAIPLTAFFITFWRLLQTQYLPRYCSGKQATITAEHKATSISPSDAPPPNNG